MPGTTLSCPSCSENLTISYPLSMGKAYQCPRCKKVLRVSPAHPQKEGPKQAAPPDPVVAATRKAIHAQALAPWLETSPTSLPTVDSPDPPVPADCWNKLASADKKPSLKKTTTPRVLAKKPGAPSHQEPKRKLDNSKALWRLVGFATLLLVGAGVALWVFKALPEKETAITREKPQPSEAKSSSRELVIGQWESKEEKDRKTVEFQKNGTLDMISGNEPEINGKYKLLNDEMVQMNYSVEGVKITRKLKIKVAKDELVITDEAGKVDHFKRSTAADAKPDKIDIAKADIAKSVKVKEAWKEFTSKDGETRFQVEFPGTPRKTIVKDRNEFVANGQEGLFVVRSSVAEAKDADESDKSYLDRITVDRTELAMDKKEVKLGDMAGIEFTVEEKRGETMQATVTRLYLFKGRVYETAATVKSGEAGTESSAKFLNSFRITDGKEKVFVAKNPGKPVTDKKLDPPKAPEKKVQPLPPAAAVEPKAILMGHTGRILAIALAPDGQSLASTGDDKAVKLWDLASAKERLSLDGHTSGVRAVVFTPDGKSVISAGEDGLVKVWGLDQGKENDSFEGKAGRIYCLALAPDGATLAVGGGSNRIKLWDLVTHKELATLEGHTGAVWSVAFSQDGKTLASAGSGDKTARIWDLSSNKALRTLEHADNVSAVAFSPDGKSLATASADKKVRLWSVESGKEEQSLSHRIWVNTLAFTRDGKLLASGDELGVVKLWDPGTGKELKAFEAHGANSATALAFTTDGKTLACGLADKTIRIFDVAKVLGK